MHNSTGTELTFSFGKYTVCVDSQENLRPFLPYGWDRYCSQKPTKKELKITVNIDPFLCADASSNGWYYEEDGLIFKAVYVENSEWMFTLSFHTVEKNLQASFNKMSRSMLTLGLQYAVLLLLAPQCVGLHGVTTICGNRVIILSAPIGTGKTTLSGLLNKHCAAAIINGDFALLSVSDEGQVMFEPTFFCGSSQMCRNYRLPVDQIVFLKQGKENRWEEPTGREAMIQLLSNTYIPKGAISMELESTVLKIAQKVAVKQYAFLPTSEAAVMLQEEVNR